MAIFVDASGVEFDLPRLTKSLDERMEAAASVEGRDERIRAKARILSEILGEDYVSRRCGEGDEADIMEVDALFAEVRVAYRIGSLAGLAAQVDQLAAIVEKMDRVRSITGETPMRRGFTSVR